MAKFTITIDSISGGISPLQYFSDKNQYNAGIAIDPDMPVTDSDKKASGLVRPTAMEKFSGSEITGVPLWFVTNPKTDKTYLYANDGKIHTINSDLTMGTALNSGNSITNASGNGAEYYDNYLYVAHNDDIGRYGPLNGTPSLTQDWWTTSLSLTALTDTTYPTINGVEMPNHVMHRHVDDKLYVADVVNGQGVLHFVKTTKTTVEGDTDDTSTFNALDFDHGYYPTSIETYGTDLAVALIEGTNTTVNQKPASLTFWDTTSSSFSKIIQTEFPDPLITAMKNINGVLWVWSGNASGGCRVSRFVGGYSFQEVLYLEDSLPPLQGAVDAAFNKVMWGGYTTYPENAAVVHSIGSKHGKLGRSYHVPFKATSSGDNGWVTALKVITHASNALRVPVLGWDDDSAKGLDKRSTTYGTSVFRSSLYPIGRPFKITKIRIPLTQAVGANLTITPKVYVDDLSSNYGANDEIPVINNTNYPNSERNIVYKPTSIKGEHNALLELRFTGTALNTVAFPITMEGEIDDD